MELDELTLHWLAGLLEGEGSFNRGLPSYPTKPFISMQMVDEDVVAKVAAIFGVKYHRYYPKSYREKGWKPSYTVRVTGKNAVRFMQLLHPLMGKRRQEQIDNALSCYRGDERYVLPPERVEELRHRSRNGENVLKLAKEFGVSKSYAYYIKWGYY